MYTNTKKTTGMKISRSLNVSNDPCNTLANMNFALVMKIYDSRGKTPLKASSVSNTIHAYDALSMDSRGDDVSLAVNKNMCCAKTVCDETVNAVSKPWVGPL